MLQLRAVFNSNQNQSNYSGHYNRRKQQNVPIRTRSKHTQRARENACKRGTICFSIASYWLRNWREFWNPIIERSKAAFTRQTKVGKLVLENFKIGNLRSYDGDGKENVTKQ